MKKPHILIACRIFTDELESIIPPGTDLEVVWIDAALHADLARLEIELGEALAKAKTPAADIRILLGHGCHPEMSQIVGKYGAKILSVKNCIEAFVGERVKELEENRTMIMTPGWVRAWPAMMKALGWNEVDFRINLGRYDRILILDAMIHPLTEEEILNFFDLCQVPLEIEPLDLSHFKHLLEEFLL
jgi:Protein of unknown function (DUF1638)